MAAMDAEQTFALLPDRSDVPERLAEVRAALPAIEPARLP
jgi:hypothetical protein